MVKHVNGGGLHSQPTPVLQVRNLTKAFGAMKAVNNLSFAVYENEILGIAGPNGAGKTTLFNVITGFYSGEGEIYYDSENIINLKPHQICHRGIARTLQIPRVFNSMTIYDNVRFGAHFGKASSPRSEAEIIEWALNFVGLAASAAQIAEHVDLYHKKLTMIAAALATRPKMLLLDEPIGGLSPREIEPLMALIKRINKELNITIIIIEHLMRVLKELSKRLLIMHYGEMITCGNPVEVMEEQRVKEVYLG